MGEFYHSRVAIFILASYAMELVVDREAGDCEQNELRASVTVSEGYLRIEPDSP
jgi:hypothetical protein